MVLSLDALFVLPRKKAAVKSHRDPLHGENFFLPTRVLWTNAKATNRKCEWWNFLMGILPP